MSKGNIGLIIAVICLLCGCANGKKDTVGSDKPVIMVTIEPQRYFTEAIAGDKYDVVSFVSKGNSPENYDPTPQQLVALKNSDAYLRIGHIGFEQVWLDRLLEYTPHLQVFDTSKDIDLIFDDHHHQDGEHHSCGLGVEPHIWNSPDNALNIARNTYRALSQLDKANEQY